MTDAAGRPARAAALPASAAAELRRQKRVERDPLHQGLIAARSNLKARDRELAWMLGWFADPIFLTGDYSRVMRERVGTRLPVRCSEANPGPNPTPSA